MHIGHIGKVNLIAITGVALPSVLFMGMIASAGGSDTRRERGLSRAAKAELSAAGVDKYLGEFTPAEATDVGDGWTKHTFDPDGGAGPICIAGTSFSAFTRAGNPSRLLIFEQGGGACWQHFYVCNIFSEDQEPPVPPTGIFDFDSPDNPLADYSIVYMPYCDGSVFSGDNDVVDARFPFGPIRFHRGLRNQSAAMDLAAATFPYARHVTLAGSSAGGIGVATFAPFLARMVYDNRVQLSVLNDAGPIKINPAANRDIARRADDWQFDQFYPPSCTDCDETGDPTAIIEWRLANDSTVRDAFYQTDADRTNRFFLDLFDPAAFRNLILAGHGLLNAAYPDRFKGFIVAGDDSHTALQSPLFYTQDANGILLNEWTTDFLAQTPFWTDVVEDAVP